MPPAMADHPPQLNGHYDDNHGLKRMKFLDKTEFRYRARMLNYAPTLFSVEGTPSLHRGTVT
eukprot:29049-Eustigmatos_ZCMA.PRE.1